MHDGYLSSDVHMSNHRVHRSASSASSCLHIILLLALHEHGGLSLVQGSAERYYGVHGPLTPKWDRHSSS